MIIMNSILYLLLIGIERWFSGLDFQKDDLFELSRMKSVKYNIIDTFSYEDEIFGIIRKSGEEGCDLFLHKAYGNMFWLFESFLLDTFNTHLKAKFSNKVSYTASC